MHMTCTNISTTTDYSNTRSVVRHCSYLRVYLRILSAFRFLEKGKGYKKCYDVSEKPRSFVRMLGIIGLTLVKALIKHLTYFVQIRNCEVNK